MAERIVLLKPEGSREIVLLEEGQLYDGWTLAEITPEHAVFRSDGREAVLELVFDIEQRPARRSKGKAKDEDDEE